MKIKCMDCGKIFEVNSDDNVNLDFSKRFCDKCKEEYNFFIYENENEFFNKEKKCK